MIIYVDIDETICINDPSRNYSLAVPIYDRIKEINALYDAGHTIIYWTARGTTTGISHEDITKRQFDTWGVKFHSLLFGKPHYDMFICDKAHNSESFFGPRHVLYPTSRRRIYKRQTLNKNTI